MHKTLKLGSSVSVGSVASVLPGVILRKFSFPKKKRLVNNEQFKAVLAKKQRFSNELLTLYIAGNDCGHPRLGVSVGKSLGKAVVRNRLKRLLREAFRQSQDRIPAGFDYVLMFSPKFVKNSASGRGAAAFEQVKSAFLSLVSDAAGKI